MSRNAVPSTELASLVEDLASDARLGPQIVHTAYLPPLPPVYGGLDPPLPPALAGALAHRGVERLWSHQAAGIAAVRRRENVLVTTPTASGKSLVFQLPALEEAAAGGPGRGLFLFPLKALGQDQLGKLRQLAGDAGLAAAPSAGRAGAGGAHPAGIADCEIYDGDTPTARRAAIRRDPPRVLISNPDMLHRALLGNWTQWGPLLADLAWIVLDELHTYRGIFGSHFHHVLQRLLRLCRSVGGDPVLIASSATAANAGGFAADLAGRPFHWITESGAPREGRHLLLLRPEGSPYTAALRLFVRCLDAGLKTIVFTKARRITELLYSWLRREQPALAARVASYRAGFLPEERRQIEQSLFSGALEGVISTSALEMGIDVGGLDACILVGYPGSMMATWQRSGRVGRQGRESITAMVAMPDALDQWFLDHPEQFLERPCERLVVDPSNEPVARAHLLCAAAELPLAPRQDAAYLERHRACVDELLARGLLLQAAAEETAADEETAGAEATTAEEEAGDTEPAARCEDVGTETTVVGKAGAGVETVAVADEAAGAGPGTEAQTAGTEPPVEEAGGAGSAPQAVEREIYCLRQRPQRLVNLRGSGNTYAILDGRGRTIGTIDGVRALHECHPGAVYLHAGRQYLVEELELDDRRVRTVAAELDYFTVPLTEKQTEILEVLRTGATGPLTAALGRLKVTEWVVGFERKRIHGQETIDQTPLDLPPTHFETVGLWWQAPRHFEETLRREGEHFLGALHASEHAAISLFPLLALCDRGDIGGISYPFHPEVGCGAVFVYDGHPGGVGITARVYEDLSGLLGRVLELIGGCPCEAGCPSCIQSPKCGNGNRPLDKPGAMRILRLQLGREAAAVPPVAPLAPVRWPTMGAGTKAEAPRQPAEPEELGGPDGLQASDGLEGPPAPGTVDAPDVPTMSGGLEPATPALLNLADESEGSAAAPAAPPEPGVPSLPVHQALQATPTTATAPTTPTMPVSPEALPPGPRHEVAAERGETRGRARLPSAAGPQRAAAPDSLGGLSTGQVLRHRERPLTVLFDVETLRAASEVGGFGNCHRMGVAIAVACFLEEGRFVTYGESQVRELAAALRHATLVVGFNIKRFDYGVLSGYTGEDYCRTLPTFDLLEDVHHRLGFRVGLGRLAQDTLGAAKSADGLQSLEWVRQGRLDLVEEYCRHDVEILRDLYLHGRREGCLHYHDRRRDVRLRLAVDW